jgi:porin
VKHLVTLLPRVSLLLALAGLAWPFSSLAEEASASAYQWDGEYRFDFWVSLSGPAQGRTGNAGLLDLKASIDAERAWGWTGTRLFAHVIGTHGNNPNRNHGGAQGLDNIEAKVDTVAVFQAWIERALLNDRASVLLGLLDLNAEFQVTESSTTLIHPGFGTASELEQTGLNAPSVFPVSSLALRGLWRFDENLSLRAAVFDGVPGDPNSPYGTHIKLGHGDGTLTIAEIAYSRKPSEYGVNKLAFGTWRYSMRFDDFVDTDAERNPLKRRSDGTYVHGERTLRSFEEDGSRGLDAFLRFGTASGDVNQMDMAITTGFLVRGPFASRPQDQYSFGIAAEHNSHKWRQAQRDASKPDPAAEVAYELTYRALVNRWLALQPDLQWLRNHGSAPVKNAAIAGIRFDLTF